MSHQRRRLPVFPVFVYSGARRLVLIVGWLLAASFLTLLYFYFMAVPAEGGQDKQGILAFGFGQVLVGGFAAALILYLAPWLAHLAQVKRLGRWPGELSSDEEY